MRNLTLAATALAAILGTTSAYAVDNGIYVGASVGDSSVDIDQEGFDIDDSATGYKVNVGWRILDWAGVEANYVDLGEVEGEFVDEPFAGEAWSTRRTGSTSPGCCSCRSGRSISLRGPGSFPGAPRPGCPTSRVPATATTEWTSPTAPAPSSGSGACPCERSTRSSTSPRTRST